MAKKGGIKMSKSKKQISYDAYKRMWHEWKDKGYKMYNLQTRKEYYVNYELSRDRGDKNIARTLAHGDIYTTRSEASKILKGIKSGDVEKYKIEYSESGKYIYKNGKRYNVVSEGKVDFDLDPEMLEKLQKMTVKDLTKAGASALYTELTTEYGFTARDAGAIVDQMYPPTKRKLANG